MRAPCLFAILGIAACAHGESISKARFANADAVRLVNDRRNVPAPPAVRKYKNVLYAFNGSFRLPLLRGLELEPRRRALGVNALDEVPDSTWFTNRIGVRDLTPDEIRKGPTTIDSPGNHLPWTVLGSKSEGDSLGLFVEDARGEKFLVKFDAAGVPEAETAAQLITGRLLWAAGYNVSEDFIVYITRGDLHVAPNATYKSVAGNTRRLQYPDLDARLMAVDVGADGRIRVMASRIIPGRALGGHPDRGVRADDPNDMIAHERRRDLRGIRPLFAWLDHIDVKESNTLDVWTGDPSDPGRHYVVHYWLDFGKSLGVMASTKYDETRSFEYYADYPEMVRSLVSLGLGPRTWDDRQAPPIVGLGLFDSRFDASLWKPSTPSYLPLVETDRNDYLWGAKLVMRFTPEQLRAAVETGQLTDSRAAEYLLGALITRQRAVGAYAFSRAWPLDNFKMGAGSSLCFDDLKNVYGFAKRSEKTSYVVTTYDRRGGRIGPARTSAGAANGHVCTNVLPLAIGGDQYTIWRIVPNGSANGVLVHVARDPVTSRLRVIGIWRE